MDSSFPEQEIIFIIAAGIVVMLLLAISFVLFFYFSQKKFQAEQLRAQAQELRYQEQLLYSSIVTQEKERQRIARELHDEIGSKLNVINLSLHRLRKKSGESLQGTLDELFHVLGTTITTTRRISHDLLPPTLESFGLEAALNELCEQYRQASGVEVRCEMVQAERPLTDQQDKLNLFRIVQELMSNSFKYAEAGHVSVQLWQGQRALQMIYQDDGKGFDRSQLEHRKGLGMRNIESRVRMLGADYQFDSAPGKGVKMTLRKIWKD